LEEEIGPFNVKVFAPIENAPELNDNVPLIVTLPFINTPLALLIVKLLTLVILVGIKTLEEDPAKDKFEEDVVDKLLKFPEIAAPLSEREFAPTEIPPLVNNNDPEIVIF